jgi:mRNA interferase HicA
MNGEEFIRKLKKWARKNGRDVTVEPQRGKGAHRIVKVSPDGITTVKSGEIKKGLKAAMMKQLKIPPDAF